MENINEHNMNELEAMRSQMQLLKQKLDNQEIVNDQLLRNAMKGKMSWINKYIWFELLVLLPVCTLNFVGLKMMDDGLEDEARKVYPLRHHNSLNTVGYKELFDFFDGTTDLEEAVRRIQSNTRRYMRKQETWFKRDNTIKWFAPTEIKEIIKYIDISLELEKE